jgi:hypothetical protein
VSVCQCVSVLVCQCVSVSVCQCVSVSVCQCVSVSVSVCQCVSVSVCQCVSVSVCQCVSVSVCQCVSVRTDQLPRYRFQNVNVLSLPSIEPGDVECIFFESMKSYIAMQVADSKLDARNYTIRIALSNRRRCVKVC